MTTKKRPPHHSHAAGKREKRCSICGKKMTAPQKTLSMDGKGYCDACYRDCFFADMGSNRHLTMDRCAI